MKLSPRLATCNIWILPIICFMLNAVADEPAPIRDFQTARLIGTSGAGAGSLLVTEAAILNPASIVFFGKSSMYAQTGNHEFEFDEDVRDDDLEEKGQNKMFFLSDNTNAIKGGMSYQNHTELNWDRTTYTATLAKPVGKNSSMGITYQYTQDKHEDDSALNHTYHFPTIGFTHVFDEKLSMGIVVKDPGNAIPDYSTSTVGFQYTLFMNLMVLADYSVNNRLRANEEYALRGALQLNIADDFYLRIGQFKNKMNETKGSSFGISWSGPRLALDYSQKTTSRDEEDGYLLESEKITEHAFGLSIRF